MDMRRLVTLILAAFCTLCVFAQELKKENYQLILAQIWRDVSYNFYDPYHLKEIGWDSLYIEYSKQIPYIKSERDYCRLLCRFLAEVHDGHTELWGAEIVEQSDTTIDDLPLGVEWIGDKLYISHVLVDLENEIPLNSEILSINGRTPDDYYRQYMYPYSSGKTLQNRRNRIQMFTGPKGDSVQFVLNRDGKEYPLHLSYNLRQNVDKGNWGTKWLNSYPIKDQLSHWKSQPEKGGFYFLRFDTFGEHLRLSQVMDNAKAEIEESDYVVLDLRFNRGGNEMTADTLLMYFADSDTLKTYKSITRAHNAFNAAMGYSQESDFRPYYENLHVDTLDEEVFVRCDGIYSIDKPVFVLIGSKTCSAAEDFLIALKNNNLGRKMILVGMPTAGTTGAPLVRRLSYNLFYRICTRWPLVPEGMFDNGIQPDYYFEPRIDELTALNGGRILDYVNQLYHQIFTHKEK